MSRHISTMMIWRARGPFPPSLMSKVKFKVSISVSEWPVCLQPTGCQRTRFFYIQILLKVEGGGQFCSVKVTKFKHLLMGSVIWYSRFTRWCNLIPSKNLNFENTYKSFSFLILSYLNFVFCRESDHSVGFYIIYIYLSAYSSKSIISFLYLLICLSVDLSIGLAVYLLICIFV